MTGSYQLSWPGADPYGRWRVRRATGPPPPSGWSGWIGDILDRDSLRRGLAGCTEVFHLAAYARNWAKDPSTFFRLNVEGARNVFKAATEAGIRRIVYTSTVVVFGPTPPGVVGKRGDAEGDDPFPHGVRGEQVRRREGGPGPGGAGVPDRRRQPDPGLRTGQATEGNRSS